MTHEEKAKEVLEHLFTFEPYRRKGLSEVWLREYAAKKWVGPNEPLSADILITEAEERVAHGYLTEFQKGSKRWFKAKAESGFRPRQK